MQLTINLTPKQLGWATTRWQEAVDSKQTTEGSVEEWLDSLFTPILQAQLDQQVSAAAISWKPEDTVEVAARRDDVVDQLKKLPDADLKNVELILEAAAESKDSDEVEQRRTDALKKLLAVPGDRLKEVEAVLLATADVTPIDEVPIDAPLIDEVPVPVQIPVEEIPVEVKPQ
jgi:PBP1b-binding outer membrane lipoprotein LpoB